MNEMVTPADRLEAGEREESLQKMQTTRGGREITMQDVRLFAGEGPLKPETVLAACNAVIEQRADRVRAIREKTND